MGRGEERQRKFITIIEESIPKLELRINLFGQQHFLVNVDAHCYHDVWYAFILYEVIEED